MKGLIVFILLLSFCRFFAADALKETIVMIKLRIPGHNSSTNYKRSASSNKLS